MQPERLIALVAIAGLAAGCTNVDDWSGMKRRKDTTPITQTDDGAIVADYLATLDRLGHGGAAQQAEIIESTRSAYLADPSTRKRLRYAFVLSVPGHAASDPAGARALLGESLATPETLLPSERAMADLLVRDLDARLALTRENETLRNGSSLQEDNRVADLNRRLQAETAEKDRLRRGARACRGQARGHRDARRRHDPAPPMKTPLGRRPRIVLVDDDPGLLRLITIRLRSEGFEVAACENASQALTTVPRFLPDVLVTDLRMKDKDGISLLKDLQGRYPALPVILLTAHGTIPDAVTATKSGAFAFLTKPVEKEQLLEQIAAALKVSGLRERDRGLARRDHHAQPGHGGAAVAGPDGRELRRAAADHRPAGHGQGAARARHSPGERAARRALPDALLRHRDPGSPAGDPRRPRRARPTRHARRMRRSAPCCSTRSATCAPDLQIALNSLQDNEPVRIISTTARNLPELIQRGTVPRGPLLPPERQPHRPAAALAAPRRHPAARRPFHGRAGAQPRPRAACSRRRRSNS